MRHFLLLSLSIVSITLVLAIDQQVVADEFGSQERGLRCYTGDLLADFRTKAASGRLKDLPRDLKTLIDNADTLAILIDYKQVNKKSIIVVGVVKKSSSKVTEFKTYPPEDKAFDLLVQEFPKFDK